MSTSDPWLDAVRVVDRALQRQTLQIDSIKGIAIGLERDQREQRRSRVDIGTAIVRSLVCRLKTYGRQAGGMNAEAMCEHLYGRKGVELAHVRQALGNLPALVQRAAVSPAALTVVGWAAELAESSNYGGMLPSLAPSSVYSQLSARGLRVMLKGNSAINLPRRAVTPTLSGDFISEGSPIPARRVSLVADVTLSPHKLAVLSHFSLEMAEYSTPSIEAVIRQEISDDTSITLDTRLLDAVASSATRPAGILNGVTPLTATAGGGVGALATDLGNLLGAISAPVDPVLIMSPGDQIVARSLAPGLLSVPIIPAPGLAAGQVIAIDAADFVSAEGDAPRFDMSEGAAMHEEDTPLPLATGVQGSGVLATPMRSLYQSDAVAVRMIQHVTWVLRRPGRVSTVASATW